MWPQNYRILAVKSGFLGHKFENSPVLNWLIPCMHHDMHADTQWRHHSMHGDMYETPWTKSQACSLKTVAAAGSNMSTPPVRE